jgi:3',5'-cyclic AMP phosphodiesterase CpdA
MNRRSFLRVTGGGLATTLVTGAGASAGDAVRRSLRVAHLTDIHVQPGLGAAAGLAAALRQAQNLDDPPELILFGGDCIGDALENPRESVLRQWDVWQQVLRTELRTPHAACLGNHDIYGWKRRGVPGVLEDPMFGKRFALDQLGLTTGHHTFDRGGWRFIVLDSMQPRSDEHGYEARLDEAQFAWLERQLAGTPATMPVCVLSHIPILSAAAFFDGPCERDDHWRVPGAWMHLDARRLKDLFGRHPQVRVCLSGHLHLEDDVTYLGVRYLCDGAVCGGWWKGRHQEFGPAFALLDFHPDGTVSRTMRAISLP